MYKACIAVVDASRARLFTFTRTSDASGVDEQLNEHADLLNPARRMKGSELFADAPSEVYVGNRGYGIDDHRDTHLVHFDQAFAAAVIAEVSRIANASQVDRIVLCAAPRTLGLLRGLSASLHKPGRVVDELARDLVKLSSHDLREYLERYGLLPSRATSVTEPVAPRAR